MTDTNEGTAISLLDQLWKDVGCLYMSDLHGCQEIAARRLVEYEADAYPIKEWQDAIHYLTQETKSFPSSKEAQRYIVKRYLPAWDKGLQQYMMAKYPSM